MRPRTSLLSDSETEVDKSPTADRIAEESSQQPNSRYVMCILWCQKSTDTTIHAEANHGRELPSIRGDSKAKTLENCSASGKVQISCAIKQTQKYPNRYQASKRNFD